MNRESTVAMDVASAGVFRASAGLKVCFPVSPPRRASPRAAAEAAQDAADRRRAARRPQL